MAASRQFFAQILFLWAFVVAWSGYVVSRAAYGLLPHDSLGKEQAVKQIQRSKALMAEIREGMKRG